MVGGEVVTLQASSCVFTPIPGKPKLKRCTFDLRLRNRMVATDLVTPSEFPRPPAGTSGLLVFPLTAVAVGTDERAVPSPDWDLGPMNFFNDFGGCSSGIKSDCYLYELFPTPLYAGESSPARTVGFDVPIAAERVEVGIVVATDLRDNPLRTLTLRGSDELCGHADATEVIAGGLSLRVRLGQDGFCSFRTPSSNTRVVNARLRLFQLLPSDFSLHTPVYVESLNYGDTLEVEDRYLLAESLVGYPSVEDRAMVFNNPQWVTLDATELAQAAVDDGRRYIQFRLRTEDADVYGIYKGPLSFDGYPELVIQYTQR